MRRKVTAKPVLVPAKTSGKPKYLVAIGASAGGLEALKVFFSSMPPKPGVAFVVIQHLSPDFRSSMDQLLAKNTDMQIFSVKDHMEIHENSIYLIPPKQNMHIEEGCLVLTEQVRGHHLNLPIDIFLESLAREWAECSIAVILSGTGSDGSRGVANIAEQGGLVLVQSPETAQFDGMPTNAIKKQCVDRVLPVYELPQAILEFIQSPKKFQRHTNAIQQDKESDPLYRIFNLLLSKYKVDFNLYKHTTIARRIGRRVVALGCVDMESYASELYLNSCEAETLYRDLLIGVTHFFRDQEAFDLLEKEVFSQIFAQNKSETIRIWVSACSTGEEAYSVAIKVFEYMKINGLESDVKIFATDINTSSLEYASNGVYTLNQIASLKSDQLNLYFNELSEDSYQIIDPIRNMVVFAQHNLTCDPPFTSIDLAMCRNFLIYIDTVTQKKILNFLRFSLKLNGYIMLGPSESISDPRPDFKPISQKWKLYKKVVKSHIVAPISTPRNTVMKNLDNSLATRSKIMGSSQPRKGKKQDRESILEDELQKTKESLQLSIEEVETTNEELQSTNEELLASVEELQSTNEELHSVNKELYTVSSERQKKIEELVSTNNDIDNFIRSTDVGTIFIDSGFNIKRFTPAILRVFDLSSQSIGLPLNLISNKLKYENLHQKIQLVRDTKKTFSKEVSTTHNDWYLMRIQPYVVKTGDVKGVIITFVDITKLKAIHDEAFESGARYRALIDATSAFVWRANKDGHFTNETQAWCDFTGQSHQESESLGWLDAVYESDRQSCKQRWLESLNLSQAFHFDAKVFSRRSHSYRYVRLEAAPLIDKSGQLFEWVFSLTDIDSEKRSDEKFRLAVQSSPFSSLIIDANGMTTFANASSLNLLGYELHEIIGKPIEALIPHGSRENHVRYRKSYMEKPKDRIMASGIEVFALSKSGEELPVEIRLTPIETDDGVSILCSMIDISTRVRAEEILQRSNEELELVVFDRTHKLVKTNEELTEAKDEYSLLYDSSPDMYASVSMDGAIIQQCNQTLLNSLGYSEKEELIGLSVFDIYSEDSVEKAKKCFLLYGSEGQIENAELKLKKKSGEGLPVMLKVNTVRKSDGSVLYGMCSWRDISVQKALEKEQKVTLELDLIYRTTQLASESTSFGEAIKSCVELVCEVIAYPVGHSFIVSEDNDSLFPSDIWHSKDDSQSGRFKKATMALDYSVKNSLPGKVWRSGQSLWVKNAHEDESLSRSKLFEQFDIQSAFAFPVIVYGKVVAVCEFFSFDERPEVEGFLSVFQFLGEQVGHVLERKKVEREFEELAHHDTITSLPNRAYFQDYLNRSISRAKRNGESLALLYLDLDNFKKVNDSLGHLIGDQLLKKVAQVICQSAREEDFVSRLGGDEFGVLIVNIKSYKQAVSLAKRIISGFTKPLIIGGHEIITSTSIGIAVYPTGGNDAYELQKNADMAMYRAKDIGRNTFQFFSAELNKEYQRQLAIETELRDAISANELRVEYQPQMSLKTGEIYGVEALVRWNNKVLGEVGPAEFISVSEDAGLVAPIGAWVLEESCRQLHQWKCDYPAHFNSNSLVLSVNISVAQLTHSKLDQQIKHSMTKYGIKSNELELELTETALMLNLETSIKALKDLSALGVGIAIDDFGTGYSSLSYLKQLPFSSLKIDRSFIQDVTSDPDDASIVKAIIQLGLIMDLAIIAEGVETESQLDFLKESGCHYGQGYLFNKPLSPAQVEQSFRT